MERSVQVQSKKEEKSRVYRKPKSETLERHDIELQSDCARALHLRRVLQNCVVLRVAR